MPIINPRDWLAAVDLYETGMATPEKLAVYFKLSLGSTRSLLKSPELLPEDGRVPRIPRKAIWYWVISRGPKPRTTKGMLTASGIPTQLSVMHRYCMAEKIHRSEGFHYSYSSNKKADFFSTPEFLEIVAIAEEEKIDILMCGGFRLLARLSIDRAMEIRKFLHERVVDLIDCENGLSLVFCSPEKFLESFVHASRKLQNRIIQGKNSASDDWNEFYHPHRGIRAASIDAEKLRKKLCPLIDKTIKKLKLSGKVSLQKIAEELNSQDIKTMRGKSWTKGTVANILSKLEIDHRA